MDETLPGIESTFVSTDRLRTHYLSCGDNSNPALILLHGNLSAATFFEELMLALQDRYWCIAPDMRGFGQSEGLPIDATRALRDPADDLLSLMDLLGIGTAHLAGWSAGAGVVSQLAIQQTQRCRSLTFIAPVSPFGYGGTHDVDGTKTAPDCAGSGGGTVSPDLVEQLRLADPKSGSAFAARQLLRNVIAKPTRIFDREERLIDAIHAMKLNEKFYPGDFTESRYWPGFAPGRWGVINALSPRYCDTSGIVDMAPKPPILWIRGDSDVVVSDDSPLDPATHFDTQAEDGKNVDLLPPPPRPQPMIGQMRNVLSTYEQNGGVYEEIVLDGVGHAPFLENPEIFVANLIRFFDSIEDEARRHLG